MQILQFWFSFYIRHLEKWLQITVFASFTDSGLYFYVAFLMDVAE